MLHALAYVPHTVLIMVSTPFCSHCILFSYFCCKPHAHSPCSSTPITILSPCFPFSSLYVPYFTLHALSCLSNDPSAIFPVFHLPRTIRCCPVLHSGLQTRLHTSLPVTSILLVPSLVSSLHSWFPYFFQMLLFYFALHLTLSPP